MWISRDLMARRKGRKEEKVIITKIKAATPVIRNGGGGGGGGGGGESCITFHYRHPPPHPPAPLDKSIGYGVLHVLRYLLGARGTGRAADKDRSGSCGRWNLRGLEWLGKTTEGVRGRADKDAALYLDISHAGRGPQERLSGCGKST